MGFQEKQGRIVPTETRFLNRTDAGRQLAEQLLPYANQSDVLVLALPRGGVPVGFEIARRLLLPLDVFVVRKLGVPGHEEFAFGAIATSGIRVLNDEVLASLPLSLAVINVIAEREQKELKRREQAYRDNKPPLQIKNHTIILVDDGIATGATMRAAISAVRQQSPKNIIAAIPVGPISVYQDLHEADKVICLLTPDPFYSVGLWYEQFNQTSDDEVRDLLKKAENFIEAPA